MQIPTLVISIELFTNGCLLFQEVRIKRKVGQSLGMMVAVSKVEDDKSVIISTVDPNGLVAKYGLLKGLTLHMVSPLRF